MNVIYCVCLSKLYYVFAESIGNCEGFILESVTSGQFLIFQTITQVVRINKTWQSSEKSKLQNVVNTKIKNTSRENSNNS